MRYNKGRERGREGEGGREKGGGREEGREGGREGGRERGRKGGREEDGWNEWNGHLPGCFVRSTEVADVPHPSSVALSLSFCGCFALPLQAKSSVVYMSDECEHCTYVCTVHAW